MKIRFNGMIEKRRHGCPVCGKKVTSETTFVTTRRFYLPSGASKTFRVNDEAEVTAEDAEFLLSYSYTDPNGVVKHVFEVV